MSGRDEIWEPLTTADAVHEAMSAGREVWSQDSGMNWHKHNLALSTTYIAHTIEAGRKYHALKRAWADIENFTVATS